MSKSELMSICEELDAEYRAQESDTHKHTDTQESEVTDNGK